MVLFRPWLQAGRQLSIIDGKTLPCLEQRIVMEPAQDTSYICRVGGKAKEGVKLGKRWQHGPKVGLFGFGHWASLGIHCSSLSAEAIGVQCSTIQKTSCNGEWELGKRLKQLKSTCWVGNWKAVGKATTQSEGRQHRMRGTTTSKCNTSALTNGLQSSSA